MAGKNRNLLEAFQDADGEPSQPAQPDLFQETRERGPSALDTIKGMVASDGGRGAVLLAGLALVFSLGFVLGRITGPAAGEVHGAEGAGAGEPVSPVESWELPPSTPPATTSGGPRDLATADPGPPSASTEADDDRIHVEAIIKALTDKTNKVTLVAITYPGGQANRTRADGTARYLRNAGFDAAPPIEVRATGELVVVVGAAATQRDLESVRRRLRTEPGPNGARSAFESAYYRNIDDILDR